MGFASRYSKAFFLRIHSTMLTEHSNFHLTTLKITEYSTSVLNLSSLYQPCNLSSQVKSFLATSRNIVPHYFPHPISQSRTNSWLFEEYPHKTQNKLWLIWINIIIAIHLKAHKSSQGLSTTSIKEAKSIYRNNSFHTIGKKSYGKGHCVQ